MRRAARPTWAGTWKSGLPNRGFQGEAHERPYDEDLISCASPSAVATITIARKRQVLLVRIKRTERPAPIAAGSCKRSEQNARTHRWKSRSTR